MADASTVDDASMGDATATDACVVESCNGMDDDCDGSSDETFECPMGGVETGTNECGRDGSRTCADDCTWPAFSRAEDADSCDYCQDDASGIEGEVPFATSTASHSLIEGASTEGTALGTCFDTTCFVDLVDASGGPTYQVGGSFLPEPVIVGYGGTALTLSVAATARGDDPGLGWALVVYSGTPPDPVLGGGDQFGVSQEADGYAVEWEGRDTDFVRIRTLHSEAADPVVVEASPGAALEGPSGTTSVQELTVSLIPDDPSTTVDDTSIAVTYPCLSTVACGSPTATIECANDGSDSCGDPIMPGDSLTIGVVASSIASSAARYRLTTGTVDLSGLCPE